LIDEEWFIIVHVAFESHVEKIIESIVAAHQSLSEQDSTMLSNALTGIATALRVMINIVRQMPHGCNEHVYYKHVRPQIMPFKNVIFSGVPYKDAQRPLSFVAGETGAQTPTLPLLDAFFGIKHAPTSGFNFVQEMRCYMLPEHCGMIEMVEGMASVRQRIIKSNSPWLRGNYNDCIRQIYEFRKLHYQLANDYIFTKETPQSGTGGTPASLWLRQLMDETSAASLG